MPVGDPVHFCGSLASESCSSVRKTLELLGLGARGIRHRARGLELLALVDEQRGVAAVVEDHVRATVRPRQRLLGAPPVLLERLALPGEDRDALRLVRRAVGTDGDRRGGVVLRREDVARGPADLGAERDERLDQHGGLDRHVQRAGDARALERLRRGELLARLHQAGHLVLGELDLLAAEVGEREVGDLEVVCGRGPAVVVMRLSSPVAGLARAASEQLLVLVLLPAQPVAGGDVRRAARARPRASRPTRLLELGLAAHSQREARRRRGRCRARQQLAQGAQALELSRAVDAVAGAERGGSISPMRSM